ncbi:MAG: nickel-type superoxide dismutase maturation protease [Patescibacteria group bacterium]
MVFIKFLKVKGDSMYPTIADGSVVFISFLKYLFLPPKVGDIVVIKTDKFNNILILKRISDIKNNEYYVLGDNLNDSFDSRKFGYIEKRHIIGKVLFYL